MVTKQTTWDNWVWHNYNKDNEERFYYTGE